MAKWICSVCGYVHEGDTPPEKCPQCKAPAEKFKKVEAGEMSWAAEHVVGVAKGSPDEIIAGLRMNLKASAPRSACIWPWPASPTARVTPR